MARRLVAPRCHGCPHRGAGCFWMLAAAIPLRLSAPRLKSCRRNMSFRAMRRSRSRSITTLTPIARVNIKPMSSPQRRLVPHRRRGRKGKSAATLRESDWNCDINEPCFFIAKRPYEALIDPDVIDPHVIEQRRSKAAVGRRCIHIRGLFCFTGAGRWPVDVEADQ